MRVSRQVGKTNLWAYDGGKVNEKQTQLQIERRIESRRVAGGILYGYKFWKLSQLSKQMGSVPWVAPEPREKVLSGSGASKDIL